MADNARAANGSARKSRDHLLHWVIYTSLPRLVVAAVSVYFLTALVFGLAYLSVGGVVRAGASAGARGTSVAAVFFFSFITQSTVGYGDYLPGGTAARLLASLQAFVGMSLFALVPAAIVVRIFSPGARAIEFSRLAIFDPERGHFRFRFVNDSRLSALRTNALLRMPVKMAREGSPTVEITRFFRVEVTQPDLWILKTHIPIILETRPVEPGDPQKLEADNTSFACGPSHVKDTRKLQVLLEVQFAVGPDQVIEHEYTYEQVVCGTFRSLGKPRNWAKFHSVTGGPTARGREALCLSGCRFSAECNLSNKVRGD